MKIGGHFPGKPFDPAFTGKAPPRRGYVAKADEQISQSGWEGGVFEIPSAGGRLVYFNPAIRDGPTRHIFARECLWSEHWSSTQNRIVRFDVSGNQLTNPHPIQVELTHPSEQWEDPRVIVAGKKTFIGVATWWPGHAPIHVNQRIAELGKGDSGKGERVVSQWSPTYGKNGKNPLWNTGNEKNWAWFEHDKDLHFVYQVDPHIVVTTKGDSIFGASTTTFTHKWTYGQLRGGTNPVRVGDEFIAFFHSSIPWKTIPKYGMRRRYFAGAYAFQAKHPYKVTRMTMEPLLTGSEYGPTIPGSPAVVFPCGLLLEGDKSFYVTYGINDCACGWVRIPVEDVLKKMEPVS